MKLCFGGGFVSKLQERFKFIVTVDFLFLPGFLFYFIDFNIFRGITNKSTQTETNLYRATFFFFSFFSHNFFLKLQPCAEK